MPHRKGTDVEAVIRDARQLTGADRLRLLQALGPLQRKRGCDPEVQASVAQIRAWRGDGVGWRDIAGRLGISEAAAKQRYFRARKGRP
jgi:hypothetical protein